MCLMQDTWLLHSVLILVQSWMEPLLYLQTTLDRYDDAPDALLSKTKWVSDKLLSLEQGVLVLIRKVNQYKHSISHVAALCMCIISRRFIPIRCWMRGF